MIHRHRHLVLAGLALASLAGCGDDTNDHATDARAAGDANDDLVDAPPAPTDAPASLDAPAQLDGGGPSGPPIVLLAPSSFTAARGSTIDVAWRSSGVSSCIVTATNGAEGAGVEGELAIVVDDVIQITAVCAPSGPAAIARITVAPACVGDVTYPTLSIGAATLTSGAVEVDPGDACIVVTDGLGVNVPGTSTGTTFARAAAHVRSASAFFFDATDAFGYVSMTSGAITLDYMNAGAPPETYISLPVLTETPSLVLANGRADVRSLDGGGLMLIGAPLDSSPGAEVIDLGDGLTLGSWTMQRTNAVRAPILTGDIAGVSGDVTIAHNAALPHAEAEALLTRLGAIAGTVAICGNLDDAPCAD